MSSCTKRCLSVLMRDCAQLELGSMGTRLGTGTGACWIQMDSVTVAVSATRLTALQTHRCLQDEKLATI